MSTARSLDQFGQCFTHAQDQAARPWSFVPSGSGGAFSNEGAAAISTPYLLRVSSTAGGASELKLYASEGADLASLARLVERCR